MAMGFSAMFTFQLDNTKHCRHPIVVMGVVDTFRHATALLVDWVLLLPTLQQGPCNYSSLTW